LVTGIPRNIGLKLYEKKDAHTRNVKQMVHNEKFKAQFLANWKNNLIQELFL
jgi:hypothetical protein